ncbi:MAG: hypothetical protein ACI9W4_000082 [Rhodothermales bacterium]|jgi:hypothetical protein
MASASLAPNSSSLAMLFNLYMQGQISERVWKRMMRLMDSAKTTKTERMALARYVRDVCEETGAASLNMPRVKELGDMLTHVRHS